MHITEGCGARAVSKVTRSKGMELLTPDERVAVQKKLPLARRRLRSMKSSTKKTKWTLDAAAQRARGSRLRRQRPETCRSRSDTATATRSSSTAITGARFKFGRVVIAGKPTPSATGADQRRPRAFPTGDVSIKQSALNLAQQHVYNLGVFSGARVGLEPLGDDPIAAVRIDALFAKPHSRRCASAWTPLLEQNRFELPRVRAEYTDRDFLGSARRLELVQQAGYAFVPSITSPDKTGPVSLTTAQITLPSVLPPGGGIDFVGRGGVLAREIQYGFNYYERPRPARPSQYRWGQADLVASLRELRALLRRPRSTSISARSSTPTGPARRCSPTASLPAR